MVEFFFICLFLGLLDYFRQPRQVRYKCADPNHIGCKEWALVTRRGRRLREVKGKIRIELMQIHLCPDCSSWEVEWDYKQEPQGPVLMEKGER